MQGEGHRDVMEEWKSMAVGFSVIGVDPSAGLVAVTHPAQPPPHTVADVILGTHLQGWGALPAELC